MNLQGIVSSGNKMKDENGACVKQAVFTRVFSFFGWIRDILEIINGEIIRELGINSPLPYTQQGSEFQFNDITPIPRELENRITSMKLLYMNVDLDVLLNNLEHTRSIQHLNLSHIRMATVDFGSSRRRALLPHLKSFSMDLLNQKDLVEDVNNFIEVKEEFIKSCLFFDTTFDQNWRLADLISLNVNVELTIGQYYKILEYNQENGKFIMTNIPDACTSVLANISPGIRELALTNCKLNLTYVMESEDQDFSQTEVLSLFKVEITD